LLLLLIATSAQAQTLDDAMATFQRRAYAEAASELHRVWQSHPDEDVREQAELYLAESLYRLDFFIPALFFYRNILQKGPNHPHYYYTVGRILELQADLHDPVLVPSLIDQNYDPEAFNRLSREQAAHINYVMG